MKRTLLCLICVLLCICQLPVVAESTAIYAEQLDESADKVLYLGTATVSLKLRKAPEKGAGSIGQIKKGDGVMILSLTEDWCKVRTERNDGYVQTKYITDISPVGENRVTAPASGASSSAAKPAAEKTVIDPKAIVAPTGNPELPTLNERGFLPAGQEEFVHIDPEDGLWIYISQTLHITIKRYADPKRKIVWEAADVLCDLDAGEKFQVIQNDTTTKTYKNYIAPYVLARRKQVVFSMNTDFYNYRSESKAKGGNTKIGIVIRDGKIVFDDPVGPKRSNHTPLSMLALYPNGEMATYYATEKTAEELLQMGVSDVLSFGPILVQDFQVTEQALKNGRGTCEPRAGIGWYDKGHFLAIVVEGRQGKDNKGLAMKDFGLLFQEQGVKEAFALDGGQTSYLCFMGDYVNTTGSYGQGKSKPREATELLGIGHSTLVPPYEGNDYQ